MKVYLYIAGSLVDLKDDNLILWNYTMEDLSNPTIVKNAYTQQITLPGTPNNNALFGDMFRMDRRQIYDAEYSGVSFDPSRKTPFEIRSDKGEILESGYMKLDKVKMAGGGREYAITLYGGLGSFFYALSYDSNGEKRSLADLDYLRTGDKEGELDFTINAAFVSACWSRLDNDTPYNHAQIADVINFCPAYNGIPENFAANKGIITPSSCGLQSSVTISGTTYSTRGGYTLVNLPEDVTEWAAKDLRSYLQRPVLSIDAFLYALSYPDNCGGFHFDCSEIRDRYFEYTYLWMTLPLLPSLPTYRSQTNTITITAPTTLKSGDNYIPVSLGTTLPSGTKVDIKFSTNLSIYSSAAAGDSRSKVYFYRYRHWQEGVATDHYNEDIAGMFVQLVAYDSNGNAVGASKVACIGDSKGQYSILGTTLGMVKDPKKRAQIMGFTPHYANLEEVYGDYYGVSEITRRSSNSNYYDLDKELTFEVSAYDIASLRLYVTPYWWHKYKTTYFIGGNTDSGKKLGADGQRVVINTNSGVYSYNYYCAKAGTKTNTATYQTSDTLRSGARVTKRMLLSTDYTPADLLLSLSKMLGLYYTYDRATNSVTLHTRNNLYQNEVIDLDSRIDRSREIDITPLAFDTKWLEMEQEVVGGAFADTYKNLYGIPFGLQRVNTGFDFNSEAKALMGSVVTKCGVTSLEYGRYYNYVTQDGQFRPSPFLIPGVTQTLWSSSGNTTEVAVSVPPSPVIENYGEDGAQLPGYDYPLDRKLQLHDAENKPIDGDGILVFLNSTGNYWHFKVTDDDATMNNLNNGVPCWRLYDSGQNLRIPIFSRYRDGDGWMIDTSLDFGRPKELNCPDLLFSDYPATIYERMWKKYLSDRYDADTRVVTCYVDLRGIQVSEELLRKFYYFDNSLYVLNRIINYSVTSLTPVQCEFVKVKDKDNYLQGQDY